jgi:cell division protein FtsL
MSVFELRIRGFRLVDVVAVVVLVAVVLGVYLAKTIAGRERAEIARVERRIDSEQARIRLLQAEVAHLEQPGRVAELSEVYLGMGPIAAKRETTADELASLGQKEKTP